MGGKDADMTLKAAFAQAFNEEFESSGWGYPSAIETLANSPLNPPNENVVLVATDHDGWLPEYENWDSNHKDALRYHVDEEGRDYAQAQERRKAYTDKHGLAVLENA